MNTAGNVDYLFKVIVILVLVGVAPVLLATKTPVLDF